MTLMDCSPATTVRWTMAHANCLTQMEVEFFHPATKGAHSQ
jgi:hypothetical protein